MKHWCKGTLDLGDGWNLRLVRWTHLSLHTLLISFWGIMVTINLSNMSLMQDFPKADNNSYYCFFPISYKLYLTQRNVLKNWKTEAFHFAVSLSLEMDYFISSLSGLSNTNNTGWHDLQPLSWSSSPLDIPLYSKGANCMLREREKQESKKDCLSHGRTLLLTHSAALHQAGCFKKKSGIQHMWVSVFGSVRTIFRCCDRGISRQPKCGKSAASVSASTLNLLTDTMDCCRQGNGVGHKGCTSVSSTSKQSGSWAADSGCCDVRRWLVQKTCAVNIKRPWHELIY